ncbi:hypothetical protein J1605_009238 [Eschrichtius robustus]|uniref:Uncharacterized protein n=1 Tax=Eschrichtius robustus TaxID=9764 RepID=A0AB34GVX4_ESCRO|nr:hypothetical protein J1605_009238 [Eschrichtius robustus]
MAAPQEHVTEGVCPSPSSRSRCCVVQRCAPEDPPPSDCSSSQPHPDLALEAQKTCSPGMKLWNPTCPLHLPAGLLLVLGLQATPHPFLPPALHFPTTKDQGIFSRTLWWPPTSGTTNGHLGQVPSPDSAPGAVV